MASFGEENTALPRGRVTNSDESYRVPVTVFTGFLGAGKTSLILNLVKEFPSTYKSCLLKNEFGDSNVDSLLATESSISVTEMINGCLCCVLVGRMGDALRDLKEKFHPDRIFVEASGSAFPASIVWQLQAMREEGFSLDAIITVVDCENFLGYEDTSHTAKLQAQYTDLIILNKVELASEAQMNAVLDALHEINPDVGKVPLQRGASAYDYIIGAEYKVHDTWTDVVSKDEHPAEFDVLTVHLTECHGAFTSAAMDAFLSRLSRDDIYRVKGVMKEESEWKLLNHAFGRWEWKNIQTPATIESLQQNGAYCAKLTLMGRNLWHTGRLLRRQFPFIPAEACSLVKAEPCSHGH